MIETRFSNLNFGTKVSTVKQETVEVNVNSEMFRDFAISYFKEASRLNYLAARDMNLTSEELFDYFRFLMKCRIESLEPGGCKLWRQIKQCWIPDFFQFSLSTVGIYVDQVYGLKFKPVFNEEVPEIDYLETSRKIEFFTKEGLAANRDAMPRGIEGDSDVMSFVILDDYVYGRTEIQAPITSYVAAFLGLKLVEETSFKMLYRVRYDDINFIKEMLTHERSLLG